MSQETAATGPAQVAHLKALLDEASDYLPDVSSRQMFGCYTLFARDHIYALVWPHEGGRIGLKIADPDRYAELMGMPGAAAWSPGGGKMGWWVLVPPKFHADQETLFKWVELAHGYAIVAPPKPKRSRAKIRK
jgi:hypothetical protein